MNSDNPSLIKAALDAGLKHWIRPMSICGEEQEANREVLRASPGFLFITTKGRLARNETTDAMRKRHGRAFEPSAYISLKRLGLDYVDILHHHGVWTKEQSYMNPS